MAALFIAGLTGYIMLNIVRSKHDQTTNAAPVQSASPLF